MIWDKIFFLPPWGLRRRRLSYGRLRGGAGLWPRAGLRLRNGLKINLKMVVVGINIFKM